MENKFGIKDGIIILLSIATLILVGLGMYQVDRQLDTMLKIEDNVESLEKFQTSLKEDIKQLRNEQQLLKNQISSLSSGEIKVVQQATTQPKEVVKASTKDMGKLDPFDRIRAAKGQDGYSQGDWYVRSFGATVTTITPLVSHDVYASIVQDLVLETLAKRDPKTLNWEPLLASSWEISEDGMTIRFKLRKDTSFSDGTPVTADDVVFSYELIMNPKIEAPRIRAYFEKIRKVEKVNDHEVIFHYAEPYFESFELAASMDILPKHFYSKYTPEQINTSSGFLLGSGPYRMEKADGWNRTQTLQVVRNNRYWGEGAPFDKMVFNIIKSDVSRQAEFLSQKLDSLSATPEQFVKLKADPEITKIANNFEYLSRSAGYTYIAWNQREVDGKTKSIFADKRVRQALTMLTPRERIIKDVMLGFAKVTSGPFHSKSKQNSANVTPWPYDQAKALALLKEVGFTFNEKRRVMLTPDGKPFSFKLTYPQGSATYEKMVPIIRSSYARVGINLEPDPLEWAVFAEKLKKRNYQAISLGWSGGIETDINQMFHSKQIADEGDNFINYSNPELDKMIEMARKEMDETKRMQYWNRCHEIMHQDQPYTFLMNRQSLIFLHNRFENVHKLEMDLNPHHEWFVRQANWQWIKP